MRKGKRYIPQKLRGRTIKKTVQMPKRQTVNNDEKLRSYYRESLLVTSQAAQYYAELLLDSDITVHERIIVQDCKNTLDKIVFGIVDQLPEKHQDLQYERTTFLTEIIRLCTFIPPHYFAKIQAWLIERIEIIKSIKVK